MAGLTERLQFLITANPDNAIAGFKKVGDSAEKELGKAEDKTAKLGASLTKFGAGAVAASAVAVTGLFKLASGFTDLAIDVGKASDVTGINIEDMSRWAEVAGDLGIPLASLEGLINKQNMAVEKSPALFEKYNVEVAKAKDGTTDVQATLLNAISAFQQIKDPTEQAAFAQQMWGKGWKDSAELISMGTPELIANLQAVSDEKVITPEELAKAKEFREAMDRLKDAGEDLALSIGQGAAPVLAGLAGIVSGAVEFFGDLDEATHGVAGKLAAIGAIGLGAAGGISLVAGKVLKMTSNIKDSIGAIKNFAGENKKLAVAMGAVGLVAIAAVAVYSDMQFEKERLEDVTLSYVDALKQEAQGHKEAVAAQVAANIANNVDLELAEKLGLTYKDLAAVILGENVPAYEALKENMPTIDANMFVQALEAEKTGLTDAREQAKLLVAINEDLGVATDDAGQATDGLTDSTDDSSAAAKRFKESTDALTEKIKEARQATIDLYDTQRSLIDGTLDYEEQVDRTEDAIATYNEALLATDGTLETIDDASRNAAAQLIAQSEAYATLNGATLTSKDGTMRQIEELQRLSSTLAPGPLRNRIDEYIAKLLAIPKTVDTVINQKFVNSGARPISGAFATGTSFNPEDGWYDVGEQGRERVWLPRGAKVQSNSEIRREERGNAATYVDNRVFNLNLPVGSSASQNFSQLERYKRRNAK